MTMNFNLQQDVKSFEVVDKLTLKQRGVNRRGQALNKNAFLAFSKDIK